MHDMPISLIARLPLKREEEEKLRREEGMEICETEDEEQRGDGGW
jgi:hypothetical protein